MTTWTTKLGQDIEYKDLDDKHLLNIIKHIYKLSEIGVIAKVKTYFDSGYDGDSYLPDYIYKMQMVFGKDVLGAFDLKGLLKEVKKRKLQTNILCIHSKKDVYKL